VVEGADAGGTQTRSQSKGKGKEEAKAKDGPVDIGAALLAALRQNREEAKGEREKAKKERDALKEAEDTGPPLPVDHHEMTDRWAHEQGMLIQPTFSVWWNEMPKPMLSLGRFPGRGRFRR
jgi:hypothetical protein